MLRERLRYAACLSFALAACPSRRAPAPRAARPAATRWGWSLPSPQGNTLNAAWSDGARGFIAVGERGAAVRSDDDGDTWTAPDTGARVALNGVCGDGDVRVAVGEGGAILRSADRGLTWSPAAHPPAGDLDAVACAGAAVLAVGRRGDLLRSHDRGLTWRALPRRPDVALRAVSLAPSGVGVAVGARGAMLRVAADGAVTPLRSGADVTLTGVVGDARGLYVVGWRGVALRCDPRGEGCAPVRCESGDDLLDVVAVDGGARAVGMRGALVTLRGDACEVTRAEGTPTLNALARSATREVTVGDHGEVRARVGGVWQPRVRARAAALFSVWGRDADRVFAVGAQGLALVSEDRGASWRPRSLGTGHHLVAVRGVGARAVVALTGGATAVRSEDGERWFEAPLGTERGGVALWAASPTEMVAVGARGSVARSFDAGRSWRAVRSGVTSALFAVWGSARSDVWAVGSRGVILRSADGGDTWAPHPSGTGADLTGVWGAGRDEVYVVGKDGTLLRLAPGRRGWARVEVPTRAALFGVWGSGADDIYAVGSGGTILHGTQRGTRWTLEPGGTDEDLLAVWGSGADDVYAVGYAGTILHKR